jgi:hypothetical protein
MVLVVCKKLNCKSNMRGACSLQGIVISGSGACWSSRTLRDIWSEPQKDWKASKQSVK